MHDALAVARTALVRAISTVAPSAITRTASAFKAASYSITLPFGTPML